MNKTKTEMPQLNLINDYIYFYISFHRNTVYPLVHTCTNVTVNRFRETRTDWATDYSSPT